MSDELLQPDQSSRLVGHLGLPRNTVGLVLMIAGVVCFVAFHLAEEKGIHGWKLWEGLFEFIENKEFLNDRDALLGYSGFVTLATSTVLSPCLISWLFQNPWIKWCLAGFSTMAAGIMWYFAVVEGLNLFMVTLALTPTLTLIGLLCIKTIPRHLPPPAPAQF